MFLSSSLKECFSRICENDELVCSEKTRAGAEKYMCRNRREKYRFWRNRRCMTANTSASPKAVVVASMLY